MKKLNIGCGNDVRAGFINLDSVKLTGVDVVHDLNKFPYPFKDNEFDEIICLNVLEHLGNIESAVKELHRILKPRGVVKIIVPHFSGSAAWTDPQHKRPFGYFSFDYFVENPTSKSAKELAHEFKFKFRKILKKRITFGKKYQIWNWPVEAIANRFPHAYEDSFLRTFPAIELYVELQK